MYARGAEWREDVHFSRDAHTAREPEWGGGGAAPWADILRARSPKIITNLAPAGESTGFPWKGNAAVEGCRWPCGGRSHVNLYEGEGKIHLLKYASKVPPFEFMPAYCVEAIDFWGGRDDVIIGYIIMK